MKSSNSGLTTGQLTMMALGAVIGGSFFLGASVAIRAAGPSIIFSYIVCGIMVYFILFALSEMTVANPDSGSFRTFASQYVSRGTGFVVGWVYWTGMVITMSSEATAVALLLRQWFPGISIPLLGSIIIIAVTLLNLLGASNLAQLENILAAIKVFAILAFIAFALLLITGLFPNIVAVKGSVLQTEPFFAGGIKSLGGSMLIVLFTFAGFEVIGLAASEAKEKEKTVPRAIRYTVFSLIALYIASIFMLLLLIPTASLRGDVSPLVSALNYYHIGWAGTAMNLILISAILSTMLAAMFGIGRMLRSLVEDGYGPKILRDHSDVPYRGILFSGLSMLVSLFVGLLFPQVYLFLISSGGFALLFTYVILMVTHIRFRKKHGKPEHNCRLCGFPYSSLFTLLGLVVAIVCMPFIKEQTSGFFAGLLLVAFFSLCYALMKARSRHSLSDRASIPDKRRKDPSFLTEFSEEFHKDEKSKR